MIDYFKSSSQRHPETKRHIEAEIGLNFIVMSAVTKMELIVGVKNKVDLAILNKQIKRFNILTINQEITSTALKLLEDYRLSHGLTMADSLIAASAIYLRLELFTYNKRDFQFIEGLSLYDI